MKTAAPTSAAVFCKSALGKPRRGRYRPKSMSSSPAVRADLDVMAAMMIAAIAQHIAHAGCAYFVEGDLLRGPAALQSADNLAGIAVTVLNSGRLRPTPARLEGAPDQSLKMSEKAALRQCAIFASNFKLICPVQPRTRK